MGKIVNVLILILALGAIVYFVQSGTPGKLFSFADKLNLTLDPSDLAPPSYDGGAGIGTPAPTSPPVSSGSVSESPASVTNRAPEGFSEENLSPYFGQVRINSAYAGSENSYGRITLGAGFGLEGRANITGWELRANRGGQFVPQAVSIYDPTGLAPEGDIFLGSGETLTLYTTQSAISRNLRLNKCIGYLENTNKFTPSLSQNCPYLGNEPGVSGFSGKCQDYVRSLSSCRLPDATFDVPDYDYACDDFLDTVNYRGCYDRHRSDADFLSRDWWAWTGRRFLDERHDKILLLDRDGKLVDVYSY